MHTYLSWVYFIFCVVGGDLTYALYFYKAAGSDGWTGIVAALFCTFVGVVPTLGSTRGNTAEFRGKMALLAIGLGACCAFGGVTAFRLIRSINLQAAALSRDGARADKVFIAVKRARETKMRSADAAAVGKAVAAVVATEGAQMRPADVDLTEPVWFPWLPWVAALLTVIFSTVILSKNWPGEDRDGNGKPDFLQFNDSPKDDDQRERPGRWSN